MKQPFKFDAKRLVFEMAAETPELAGVIMKGRRQVLFRRAVAALRLTLGTLPRRAWT
jgi:hypothetical protein